MRQQQALLRGGRVQGDLDSFKRHATLLSLFSMRY